MAERTCRVSGCDKTICAKGLCRRHYDMEREGRQENLLPPQESGCDWRSIDHFVEWVEGRSDCSHGKPLILDSLDPFEPEDWQLHPVKDLLSWVFRAIWLIVPEANGKTTLLAAVVLYLLEHQTTPEIPIGSATVTQAETLFRQIEGFIVRSEKLGDFKLAPGLRRIDCAETHGHVRVYPHNERSGDGVIPSAAILDEGHLHPDLRLYRTWKGKYRKRKGPIFLISTAGEPGGEFEELRSKMLKHGTRTETGGKKGQFVRVEMGDTVLHDWGVRDSADADDFDVVAEANPLADIEAAELAEKFVEPEMTEEHWRRRTCNIPTREEGTGVTPSEWDALEESDLSPDRDAETFGFIDLGWKIDTTAMGVLVWEAEHRRVIAGVRILQPPVEEGDIVAGLVALQREFSPVAWVYDPNAGGRQMVQLLESGKHPDQEGIEFVFIEHSQDNAPMTLAAERFDEAVRSGWFVHDGNRQLRAHVLNAIRKSAGLEKYRYDRPRDAKGDKRKKYPIDALTGLLMGNSVAVAEHEDQMIPLVGMASR